MGVLEAVLREKEEEEVKMAGSRAEQGKQKQERGQENEERKEEKATSALIRSL